MNTYFIINIDHHAYGVSGVPSTKTELRTSTSIWIVPSRGCMSLDFNFTSIAALIKNGATYNISL